MTVQLITDSSRINAKIKSLSTRDKKLHADKIQLACSVLNHAEKHNDVTLATKFAEAIYFKREREAFINWCEHYGRMKWAKSDVKQDGEVIGQAFGFVTTVKGRTWKGRDINPEALEVSYFEGLTAPENAFDPVKVEKQVLAMLISKAKLAEKNGAKKLAAKLNKMAGIEVEAA